MIARFFPKLRILFRPLNIQEVPKISPCLSGHKSFKVAKFTFDPGAIPDGLMAFQKWEYFLGHPVDA